MVEHQLARTQQIDHSVGAVDADILEGESPGITDPDQLVAADVGILHPDAFQIHILTTTAPAATGLEAGARAGSVEDAGVETENPDRSARA
ncbi:MAG: hypothetical protein MUC91_02445 [Verrucomicrobia bacterium]|nr:hypothetical protein [Verrucomicrobiota bacterium]